MHIWGHILACPSHQDSLFRLTVAFSDFLLRSPRKQMSIFQQDWFRRALSFHRFSDRLFHQSSAFLQPYTEFLKWLQIHTFSTREPWRRFFLAHLMVDIGTDWWLWQVHTSRMKSMAYSLDHAFRQLSHPIPGHFRWLLQPAFWKNTYEIQRYIFRLFQRSTGYIPRIAPTTFRAFFSHAISVFSRVDTERNHLMQTLWIQWLAHHPPSS